VGLDAASSTSNRLARVLIEKGWFASPRFALSADPAADWLRGRTDAALVIGDRALEAPAAPFVLDLGTEWKRLTNLPFVFAAWVEGRRGRVAREDLEALLDEARRRSPRHIDAAAREHSRRTGLDAGDLATYLRERISYRFGPGERAAMRSFLRLALPWAPRRADPGQSVGGGHACASS
jgi:predicted solute-binding protein